MNNIANYRVLHVHIAKIILDILKPFGGCHNVKLYNMCAIKFLGVKSKQLNSLRLQILDRTICK